MNEPEWMQLFEVFLLLVIALLDLYSHKIPNYLVVIGLASGIMNRFMDNGSLGIVIGVGIGAALVIVFIPLYLLRVFGAGDIKLLAVLCVFLRPGDILKTLFVIFLAGAVFSLIKLVSYGNLCSRIRYLFRYGLNFLGTGQLNEYDLEDKREELILPMAVPIFFGGILSIGGLL